MSYTYVTPATVQPGQVTGTLLDFPALLFLSGTRFKSQANGGHIVNTDAGGPADFAIFSTADLAPANKLPHEFIGTWDAVNGTLAVFVKVPSCAVGTKVYVAYSDAAVTTRQDNPTAVWNTAYQGVWHYPDGSTLTTPTPDSTTFGHHGTITGATAVAGQVDGAAAFAANTHLIEFASGVADLLADWTISGWFQRPATGVSTDGLILYGKSNDVTTNRQILIYFDSSGSGTLIIDIPFVSHILNSTTTFPVNGGIWHHYAVTRSGTAWALYINGNPTPDATATDASVQEAGGRATVGNWPFNLGGAMARGYLDETRIMNAAMAPAWIAADYKTQKAPTSFWTLGAEATRYRLTGDAGTATLTGSAATLRQGRVLVSAPGAATITGTSATVRTGHRLAAGIVAASVTGASATLVYRAAALTYTLAADPGAVAATGMAAALRRGRRLTAGTSTYQVLGSAIAMRTARWMAAGPAAYTLRGYAASLYTHTAEADLVTTTLQLQRQWASTLTLRRQFAETFTVRQQQTMEMER